MLRRLAGIAGLFLLASIGLVQAQTYAQNKTDIKAGILIIDSAQTAATREPLNFTPHVWYNLDLDLSVKPAGWNILNPRPITQVTPAVQTRWQNLTAAGLTVGATLGKQSGAYWEVRLSQVGEQQLSEYDLLLLSAYGFTSLNSVERDKMRKFVDQGGILWIDVNSATSMADSQINTFPVPFNVVAPGAAPLTTADVFHPLMTTPYGLSLSNLEQIRTDTTSYAKGINLGNYGMSTYWPIQSWIESDYDMHFLPIASNGANGPTVLVARLGSGFVVLTTSGYAQALNRVSTAPGVYNPNTQFNGLPPAYDRTTQIAAKLAINMLYLAASHGQPGGNSRKSNGTPIGLNPPLLSQTREENETGIIRSTQSPVIYKGLLVVSVGDKLKVFDARPKTDQDGNADPDDGIRDMSLGSDYDELWESRGFGVALSPPTCGEVPGAAVKDQIWVVDANGILHAFDAFALSGGLINPSGSTTINPLYDITPPETSSFDQSLAGAGPYAPTLHDGLLYMTDVDASNGTGIIWVADPHSQLAVTGNGEKWYLGSNGAQTLPQPSGSPTIGYIPIQDNSGGYDRVMYFPGRPNGSPSPAGTASITSLWMGARGESPPPGSVDDTVPGTLTISTRAARQGINVYVDSGVGVGAVANRALGVKLTVLEPNAFGGMDPMSNSRLKFFFDGSVQEASAGVLQFGRTTNALPPGCAFRLDYSISWRAPINTGAYTTSVIRGQLYLPDDYTSFVTAADRRRIIGNIAMSPRGTIYCITSSEKPTSSTQDCGSFFAIREDIGRGGFRLLTRYDLYPDHIIPLNQGVPVKYHSTVADADPVTAFMPFVSDRYFSHLTFMGSPAVRDGVVYVTAEGRKPGVGFIAPQVPYNILMAFKAEPETPEIRVGDIPDGFSLRQYDIDRSKSHTAPLVPNDMSQGQFSYNRAEGVIRFDNLMTANRGPMVNAFSTSQPVVLRRSNQPDQLFDPEAYGNRWSPLLWYTVMHGVSSSGGPVVAGSAVFVPGTSLIPNLDQLALGNFVISGLVEAWDTNVSPNDSTGFLGTPDPERPWLRQMYQLQFGPIQANPHLLWPQLTNLRDRDDYIIRVRQTKLGGSTKTFAIAAGEGILAATGDKGVYAYTKADFLIADEGRLGRYDANGNPLWIANVASSTGAADTGSVGAVKPLTRPVRAYPLGENDVVVVDPGANRIARIDLSGRETRSLTSFVLDPANIPDGFKANEPLTLNAPRDVAVFSTFEAGGTEYWVHYLVADSGNKRLVEVVDKYNLGPNRQVISVNAIGVLAWHSPSNYSGKDFEYNSVSRILEPISGRYFYIAGTGGASPTRTDSGLDSAGGNPLREEVGGNGGIMVFDPTNPSGNVVINQIMVPDIPADAFWNFQTGMYGSTARPAHPKKLSNMSSVTARIVWDQGFAKPRVAIMFTDATGVYEVWLQDAANDPKTTWFVRWMLPNEAYRALRQWNGVVSPNNAMDLRATYARRMEDGDVIVVNGYLGTTRGDGTTPPAAFNGEVLQLIGDLNGALQPHFYDPTKPNLGFDNGMIVFQLPPIFGARGLVLPVFADRR